MKEAPGELIASGRDADIFDVGHGRVLRRARGERTVVGEARIMEYVRAQGYPAPEVFEVSDDGFDLTMERVDGPSMVDAGSSRPWKVRGYGAELARLHRELHQLPAPEWVPDAPVGTGERFLHMDLHPLNVLMSSRGPVVIDWTNAARGDPRTDVALTWILVASGEVPTSPVQKAVLAVGRRLLMGGFLSGFDVDDVKRVLGETVEYKCADPNMTASEVARMRALARDGR